MALGIMALDKMEQLEAILGSFLLMPPALYSQSICAPQICIFGPKRSLILAIINCRYR